MTKAEKLEFHLEMVIWEEFPDGTRLNFDQLTHLMSNATPEQHERAFQRALTRAPLLIGDERER